MLLETLGELPRYRILNSGVVKEKNEIIKTISYTLLDLCGNNRH
jgi:hypothetical protein